LKCAWRFHVTNVRFFVACVKYIFTLRNPRCAGLSESGWGEGGTRKHQLRGLGATTGKIYFRGEFHRSSQRGKP
jgi:hypothetical protein